MNMQNRHSTISQTSLHNRLILRSIRRLIRSRGAAFLAIALAIPTTAGAQQHASGSVESEFVPKTGIDTTTPETEDFEISFSTLRVRGNLPVVVGNSGTVLIPGINYSGTFADTKADPGSGSPDSFHEIGLSATLMQPLSRTWGLLLNYSLGLATNFEDMDGDHIRSSGVAMATYRHSNTLNLGLGAVANYSFGKLLPLPALRVDWAATSDIQVKVFIPESAKAIYRFGNRAEIGLAAFLQGNQYTVSDSDNPELDSVKYTIGHGGAVAGVRFFDGFWVSGYVGHTAFRKFDLEDRDGMELAKTDVRNAPIVRFSIEFRPQGPGARSN